MVLYAVIFYLLWPNNGARIDIHIRKGSVALIALRFDSFHSPASAVCLPRAVAWRLISCASDIAAASLPSVHWRD